VSLEQGCAGRGWSGIRGCRSVWCRTMAGGTGASPPGGELSTGPDPESVHTETQWQTSAAGNLYPERSNLHDGSDAGARTDLRDGSSYRAVRLRQGYLGTVRRKGRIRQAKPNATAPHLSTACSLLGKMLFPSLKPTARHSRWRDANLKWLSPIDLC